LKIRIATQQLPAQQINTIMINARAPRLPASPLLITFQYQPLVVSLSEIAGGACFHVKYTPHPVLKRII